MSTLRGKHLIVCEQVLINSREVADNPGFVSLFEGKRRANKVPFFFLTRLGENFGFNPRSSIFLATE